MSTTRLENLELRALEQRNRLHKTAGELKTKVTAARAKLQMSRNVRQHLVGVSVFVSLVGFLLGYGLAGMFTER
jgi:hypothetical protein